MMSDPTPDGTGLRGAIPIALILPAIVLAFIDLVTGQHALAGPALIWS